MHNAPATFFVTGACIKSDPGIVLSIAPDGSKKYRQTSAGIFHCIRFLIVETMWLYSCGVVSCR